MGPPPPNFCVLSCFSWRVNCVEPKSKLKLVSNFGTESCGLEHAVAPRFTADRKKINTGGGLPQAIALVHRGVTGVFIIS